jgi:hypothetical protein
MALAGAIRKGLPLAVLKQSGSYMPGASSRVTAEQGCSGYGAAPHAELVERIPPNRIVTCYASGMSRPKQYENAAARQAAYRARKGTPVQVLLDPELVAALDDYIARQQADKDADATRSSVIAKLLRSQLLRRR